MQHRQIFKSSASTDTTDVLLVANGSHEAIWGSWLTKLLCISTLLIMSVTINPALAYPAYSHSKALPHRSVIYFAPTEDSVVKEFLNEVLINNCQVDERDVVVMDIAESGYTIPT